MKDIPNLNSISTGNFDPYRIFDKSYKEQLGRLGASFIINKASKPLTELIIQGDPLFAINDVMIAGLVKIWQRNTRAKNRALVSRLIQFHSSSGTDVEIGLYTLMVLSSLRVGKTTLLWYCQLDNPIRANVIKSFVVNIPKSISEGSSYWENVGFDLLKEKGKACTYYFDELNKTLLSYLLLTCYYQNKASEPYLSRLIENGYHWLDSASQTTEDLYDHMYKLVLPGEAAPFAYQTLSYVYEKFGEYKKELNLIYRDSGMISFFEEYYRFISKNSEGYLNSFSSMNENDKEN